MPNAPKTPTRTIRVSSDLGGAGKEKEAIEVRTVTDVIVEALKGYVNPSQRTPGYPDQELWDRHK